MKKEKLTPQELLDQAMSLVSKIDIGVADLIKETTLLSDEEKIKLLEGDGFKELKNEFYKLGSELDKLEELTNKEDNNTANEIAEIYFNAIKTPDGTVISSRHRHDYVTYEDKNGQFYAVDGGDAYLRRGFDVQDYEELSIDSNTEFSEIRKKFHWGNRGKDGKQPLSHKSISEMSNSHLEAVLENVFKNITESRFKTWFEKELDYRKENGILIED